MKFKGLVCIILVVILISLVGCRGTNNDVTTTLQGDAATTTTTVSSVATTAGGNTGSTTINGSTVTTLPTGGGTTSGDEIPPTINQGTSTAPKMDRVSVYGLPAIVGDSRNRLKVSAAGILNGNAENPMFILVTNIGEDDIFSATITANAGGKTVNFNISYLPRGGSVWAESAELYKYNADDKFIVNTSAVVVTSTAADVPVDRNYSGILNIYAGEKDGGRGIFIENVSGKTIKKLVIKYRPTVDEGGLYAAPSQVSVEDFADGAKAFKANSYLYDVEVVDVQISYK